MNWRFNAKLGCEQSDDGCYTVPQVGSSRGPTWEAWRYGEQLAVDFKKIAAAKQYCEARHMEISA